MPLPGKQKTIAFPFIRALIASISHSGALVFGATVFTLNPFAIKLSSLHYYFTPLYITCQSLGLSYSLYMILPTTTHLPLTLAGGTL